jgi:hypothetical protein
VVEELPPESADFERQLRSPQVGQLLPVVQSQPVGDAVRGQVSGQEAVACGFHPDPHMLFVEGRVAA